MAAFAPLKLGGWAYGEILTSAQMNQLNTDFPYALNLRDGASYAPTGSVAIETPTTKTVTLNGCTFVATADGGSVQCASGISAVGQADCGTLNVGTDATVNNDLTVLGDATFTALAGNPTLNGTIVPIGSGRVIQKVQVTIGQDADFAIGPGGKEYVTVPGGWFTADRAMTIVDDGGFGEAIEIEMLETVRTLTVKHPTSLATLLVMKNASGFANWARFRKVGSSPTVFAVVAKYVVP